MSKRKKRVRSHVIADMSLHHVAYQVVKSGYTLEATQSDYGYDASVFTYDGNGEVENGNIFIQLKATDNIKKHSTKNGFSFKVGKRDIDLWLDEPFPVYLVLFDASSEAAYWVYIQKYLRSNGLSASSMKGNWISIRMDKTHIVDVNSLYAWRAHKADVLAQMGTVNHV